jgi:hypothetical protein
MQKWIVYAAAPTKKNEAMHGGDPPKVVRVFGRAGDVWSVAQEASAEVTVAGVSCEREKKRFAEEREGLAGEEREPRWQLGGCVDCLRWSWWSG